MVYYHTDIMDKTWNHITTRIMGLYEIAMANYAYPGFKVGGGLPLDTVIIGKEGLLERYVDQDQLTALEQAIQANASLAAVLEEFENSEKEFVPVLEKNPIDALDEFMPITKQLWIHEINAFFAGLFSKDEQALEIASRLRGPQGVQHISISEFLPKLFEQISEKTQIGLDLLRHVMPEELPRLDYDEKVLQSRQKFYVLEQIGAEQRLLVDKESEAYSEKFLKDFASDIDENVDELTGSVAHKGHAAGEVVIVKYDKDLENVKEGSILVSPMTRTSFLPAMKRAGAFVTDEGGVTCHAAIVARELKKPCVVGTRVASKVLNSGDVVEVDATNGKVFIKSRKHAQL